jgi:chromosomal replication initiator protein
LSTCRIVGIKNNTILLLVQNEFSKEILSKDFNIVITESLGEVFNTNVEVNYVLESDLKYIDESVAKFSREPHADGLDESMTYENFIIGQFNKDAYTATVSILSNPGIRGNPLFIYGSSGVGKTHLANAFGYSYFKKYYPKKSVKCINSENFTREIYETFKQGSEFVEKIKNEYSKYDMLIIDDVQFLTGRDKTLEIFFNIFNEFIKNKKHIVMTCDKKPSQLNGFEERMVSRFSSGLSVEIKRPDIEIMRIILESKLKRFYSEISFDSNSINYIAKVFNDDIRKLEGAIQKIYFYFITNNVEEQKINLEICKKIFEDDENEKSSDKKTPSSIIHAVCTFYGVDEKLVRSKSRVSIITNVRHMCIYIMREKTTMTLNQIGAEFSGRDHSTVNSSVEIIKSRIMKDANLVKDMEKILTKI